VYWEVEDQLCGVKMEQMVGRKTLVEKKAGMGIHKNTHKVMKTDATKVHNITIRTPLIH
jgi:hypothetical protein